MTAKLCLTIGCFMSKYPVNDGVSLTCVMYPGSQLELRLNILTGEFGAILDALWYLVNKDTLRNVMGLIHAPSVPNFKLNPEIRVYYLYHNSHTWYLEEIAFLPPNREKNNFSFKYPWSKNFRPWLDTI